MSCIELILCHRCVTLLPPPDDIAFLRTAHTIYVQYHKFPEALALAIRLSDSDLIREDFNAPGNPYVSVLTESNCLMHI